MQTSLQIHFSAPHVSGLNAGSTHCSPFFLFCLAIAGNFVLPEALDFLVVTTRVNIDTQPRWEGGSPIFGKIKVKASLLFTFLFIVDGRSLCFSDVAVQYPRRR